MVLLLKVMASGFIIWATTTFGFTQAGRYRDRPRHLRQLQSALGALATEINYGATPLPLAFSQLAGSFEPPGGILFRAVADSLAQPGMSAALAWQEGLMLLGECSALTGSDVLILQPLGAVLGKSDRLDQERHLRLTMQHLERAAVEAEEERATNERLWRSLGVLSGLLLVIILL